MGLSDRVARHRDCPCCPSTRRHVSFCPVVRVTCGHVDTVYATVESSRVMFDLLLVLGRKQEVLFSLSSSPWARQLLSRTREELRVKAVSCAGFDASLSGLHASTDNDLLQHLFGLIAASHARLADLSPGLTYTGLSARPAGSIHLVASGHGHLVLGVVGPAARRPGTSRSRVTRPRLEARRPGLRARLSLVCRLLNAIFGPAWSEAIDPGLHGLRENTHRWLRLIITRLHVVTSRDDASFESRSLGTTVSSSGAVWALVFEASLHLRLDAQLRQVVVETMSSGLTQLTPRGVETVEMALLLAPGDGLFLGQAAMETASLEVTPWMLSLLNACCLAVDMPTGSTTTHPLSSCPDLLFPFVTLATSTGTNAGGRRLTTSPAASDMLCRTVQLNLPLRHLMTLHRGEMFEAFYACLEVLIPFRAHLVHIFPDHPTSPVLVLLERVSDPPPIQRLVHTLTLGLKSLSVGPFIGNTIARKLASLPGNTSIGPVLHLLLDLLPSWLRLARRQPEWQLPSAGLTPRLLVHIFTQLVAFLRRLKVLTDKLNWPQPSCPSPWRQFDVMRVKASLPSQHRLQLLASLVKELQPRKCRFLVHGQWIKLMDGLDLLLPSLHRLYARLVLPKWEAELVTRLRETGTTAWPTTPAQLVAFKLARRLSVRLVGYADFICFKVGNNLPPAPKISAFQGLLHFSCVNRYVH